MIRPKAFDIGFCWRFPKTEPEEGLRRLGELGFDGIELWPDGLQEWGVECWAAAFRATGGRCIQLCPYFDFMKGGEGIEKSRALLTEFLEAARVIGCTRLRVFTGPPWGEGVVGAREATERQWRDAIDTLRDFCDRAAPQGIELCLECHEGSLMEDASSALRLIEGIARLNLTTNLQLPLRDEAWIVSLAALARTTTHVHIHNWTLGPGKGELTFLDEGAFDWEPVVRTLLAEGPAHVGALALSVEHSDHGGRHDPWETARRDGIYLNRLRAKLKG